MAAKCIAEVGNWSKIMPEHKFDKSIFSKQAILDNIENSAPKLKALVDNIQALDKKDMKKHKHLFKHFIYCDQKTAYSFRKLSKHSQMHIWIPMVNSQIRATSCCHVCSSFLHLLLFSYIVMGFRK